MSEHARKQKPSSLPSGEEIDEQIWAALQTAAEWPVPDRDDWYPEWVLSGIGEARAFRIVIEFALSGRMSGRLPEHFSVLDVGTSLGVIPLTLKHYGAQPSACDAGDKFEPFLAAEGVRFSVCDLAKGVLPYEDASFDLIVCKDTVEHLPFSPKHFLAEVHRTLSPSGFFVLSCPNIARLSARAKLLAGRSVHPPLDYWYESEFPFPGHFREYTLAELRTMLIRENFDIVKARRTQMQDAGSLKRERAWSGYFPKYRRGARTIAALSAWSVVARIFPTLAQHNLVISRKAPGAVNANGK